MNVTVHLWLPWSNSHELYANRFRDKDYALRGTVESHIKLLLSQGMGRSTQSLQAQVQTLVSNHCGRFLPEEVNVSVECVYDSEVPNPTRSLVYNVVARPRNGDYCWECECLHIDDTYIYGRAFYLPREGFHESDIEPAIRRERETRVRVHATHPCPFCVGAFTQTDGQERTQGAGEGPDPDCAHCHGTGQDEPITEERTND